MSVVCEKLEAVLRTGEGFPPGSAGLVGVSGGRDSMVLLHALDLWRRRQGWRLVVGHFHHGLRGGEADADAAFVAAAAAERGLECVTGRADVGGERLRGESVEVAGRRLRHAFLARAARGAGCKWVALGHHGGDQAELFLMRLLMGAGAAGLGGMRRVGRSPADEGLVLVRPLLDLESGEVAVLAEAWGVRYRTDSSNADWAHRRNRVRHELMPLLRAGFQPALERVLLREQAILRDQAEWVERLAEEWLMERERDPRGGRGFGDLPVALQREVLRVQMARLGQSWGFERIEALRLRAGVPVETEPGCRWARREDGLLERVAGGEAGGFREAQVELDLRGTAEGGEAAFGGGVLRWEWREGGGDAKRTGTDGDARRPGEEWMDADAVGGRVCLRHWRPGDRFAPIGLGAAARLQDLFTAARVPPGERRGRVLAATAGGEVFWVEGLRIGERARVRDTTVRRLVWRWERTEPVGSGRPASFGDGA
jgi:tRNA(Ile)-lysidine synthase